MLSIIVPVYNVKDYLGKCLKSLHNQKLTEYEVIIVDDGSTDGSGKILDAFCEGKDKFRVIHKKNGGLMSAWVEGVKNSTGDYLGFVDSDDYVADDMFLELYKKAIETKAEIIMCDFFVDEKSRTQDLQEGFYDKNNISVIYEMILPAPGKASISTARWNKIFRKDIILNNLKYCECLSRTFEDRYIVPAALYSANTFYYIKKPMYYNISRAGSNSGMYKKNLIEDILKMYDIQKHVLEDKKIFDVYESDWEKAFLDYIRVYVGRNVIKVTGFRKKLDSVKRLFDNSIVQKRLDVYGKEMVGKLGKCVYLSFRIKMPVLLVFMSYFS